MKRENRLSKRLCLGFTLIALVVFLIFEGTAAAEAEESFHAGSGLYIGISLANNTLKGDFDGETILTGPSDIILVPKVDSGTGLKIVLGGRSSSAGSEISYAQSDHDISFLGLPGEAELKILSFDFKPFFQQNQRMQPFLLLGINFSEFTVKEGSANATLQIGDAKYIGIGFDLGGGIAYYFNPHAALHVGLTYRWIRFGSAKGVDGGGTLDDPITSKGVNFDTGLTYTF